MKTNLSSGFLGVLLSLAAIYAHPIKRSGVITVPLRRQETVGAHPELRHRQQMNRADRLLARSFGRDGPSDEELRQNLERTLSGLVARGEILSDQIYSFVGRELSIKRAGNPPVAQDSVILNIDGSDTQYLATITIGTPPRNFTVVVDSGSAVFWVGSDTCKSDQGGGSCGPHTTLSEKESSSFVKTNTQWQAVYGSGNASGTVVRDNVVIAGIQLTNFTFGVANLLSSEFTTDAKTDGLLGLARSSITALKLPTPVEEMAARGLIPAAITSYRIPHSTESVDAGEISFGGLDETRFNTSTLVTMPSTDTGFWVAKMGPILVNNVDVGLQNRSALLDTGTTLMSMSADDAKVIHAKIPGAVLGAQGYTVPCNTTAVLALTFGGRSFPMNATDLARGSATQTTGACGSGIAVGAQGDTRWLVGDTFLKSVYYSTNAKTNEISLASLS